MKKKKIIIGILIVAWIGFIWGHSMQPADVSDGESGRFLAFFSTFIPALKEAEDGMFIIRKAAHFTEYTILGVLLSLEFVNFVRGWFRRFVDPVLGALTVAFIDETIQLFVEGRSGQVSDIWIDVAGAALGTLITLAIFGNRRGKRAH